MKCSWRRLLAQQSRVGRCRAADPATGKRHSVLPVEFEVLPALEALPVPLRIRCGQVSTFPRPFVIKQFFVTRKATPGVDVVGKTHFGGFVQNHA